METQSIVQVINGNNQFASKFYSIISKKQKGNVLFSPISAHALLSMIYQAAVGETVDLFSVTLNVPNKEITANGYKSIIDNLKGIEGLTLHIANKIYVAKDVIIKDAFKGTLTDSFASEAEIIDFTLSKKAVRSINHWVENQTNSKIKTIVDSGGLSSSTRVMLLNAVYFKGNWLYPFDKKCTAIKPFYLSEKRKMFCSMMFVHASFLMRFDETLDAQILEMNYVDEKMSMVIILPNAKDGIESLETKLMNIDLSAVTRDMHVSCMGTNVFLPKFKIETTMNLQSVLTEMGLGVIFSSDANFSDLTENSESLHVSQVIQKAYIEVNEEGTEAAAVTSMEMFMSAPEEFIADHPFIILIQLKCDGLVNTIFYGKVMKPDY